MRILFLMLLICSTSICIAQNIEGYVKDSRNEPVFAANVYLKFDSSKGATTDIDGYFKLEGIDRNDTLVISFLGYITLEIPLKELDFSIKKDFILKGDFHILEEVRVLALPPISEEFSVRKISRMDIYLNPVSQGDPLKSITTLPSSTTLDETANPSLRGSSSDRSRVILNGVPIYKPVRSSQLNNQGFFSLFNPEIIENEYVYASNPPLTHGNTSAGLVELLTNRKNNNNQLQLSTGLASVGLFKTLNLKKETAFIQMYGNYQFSDAFVEIQKKSFPDIDFFRTADAGLNFHTKIGKKIEFNTFNYLLKEKFGGYDEIYTYKGHVDSDNLRFFTVNNLKLFWGNSVLSFNNGFNHSTQNFGVGNFKSNDKVYQLFGSLDYKWYVNNKMNIQLGISHDSHKNDFNDEVPIVYYAISDTLPSYESQNIITNSINEAYVYAKYNVNSKWALSTGIRKNIPDKGQKNYLSWQTGIRYQLNKRNSFLLSGGQYSSYSTPTIYSRRYHLLASNQVEVGYFLDLKNVQINSALYYKNETGEKIENELFSINETETFGAEIYVDYYLFEKVKFTFSNSFIEQKMYVGGEKYNGYNDLNYYIKVILQYSHPKITNVSLAYFTRPGTYYNSITHGIFNENLDVYEPVYGTRYYDKQFAGYNRLDLNITKYLKFKKNALVVYFTVNNLLNTKNQKDVLYSNNYSQTKFDYYQLRTIYFGAVFHFNYNKS